MRITNYCPKHRLLLVFCLMNFFVQAAIPNQPPLTATLNGVVFNDCNGNGIRDQNEIGLSDVPVVLKYASAPGDTIVQNTITDASGHYFFNIQTSVPYTLSFGFPGTGSGLAYSPQDQGGNDNVDSDIDPLTGSYVFEFFDENGTLVLDAGLVDSEAPVLSFNHPLLNGHASGDTLIAECGNLTIFNASHVVATDNSGQTPNTVFHELITSTSDCQTSGYLYYLKCFWTATDTCGNSSEIHIIVKVVDHVPPVLIGVPEDLTVACAAPPAAQVTGTDLCNNNFTITLDEHLIYDNCIFNYTLHRIWTAKDLCGNITRDTQLIVMIDTLPPVINGAGDVTIHADQGESIPGTGSVTIADGCDPDAALNHTENSQWIGCNLFITRHWTAEDHCGNISETTQHILVVYGNPAPLLVTFAEDHACYSGDSVHISANAVLTNIPAGFAPLFLLTKNNGNIVLSAHSTPDFNVLDSGSYTIHSLLFATVQQTSLTIIPGSTTLVALNGMLSSGGGAVCGVIDFTGATIVVTGCHCDPPQISNVQVQQPTCNDNNGQVSILMNGNINEYNFIWNPNLGTPGATANIRTHLPPGHYDVIVSDPDTSGCFVKLTITLTADLSGQTQIQSVVHTQPTNCATYNGTITIQASGPPNLIYSVDGGLTFQPSPLFTNLGPGYYQAVVANNNGNCASTGAGFLLSPQTSCIDTVYITTTGGTPLDTCLDNVIDINTTIGSATVCNVDPDAVNVIVHQNDPCVTLDPVDTYTGTDTICVIHCGTGAIPFCDTTIIIVTVLPTPMCEGLFELPALVLSTPNCTGTSPVCLPVPLSILQQYSISDNQQPYTGLLTGCDVQNAFSYNFFILQGVSGPYHLDSWPVNGVVHTGNFPDIASLMDSINVWDTQSNWFLDPATYSMMGGKAGNTYGTIHLTQPATGAVAFIQPLSAQVAFGSQINLNTGFHQLYFYQSSTACSDTLLLMLNCSNPTDSLPVAVNDITSTLMVTPVTVSVLNNDDVNGSLEFIGIVQQPAHGTAVFNANNTLTYTPNPLFTGIDSVYYMICNDYGCDSAWVIIAVVPSGNDLSPVATEDHAVVQSGSAVNILILNNDILNGSLSDIYIVNDPLHGQGVLNANHTLTYTPVNGFCGNDTLSYGICNSFACDSALVIIHVLCSPPGDSLPVAIDDNAATLQGNPVLVQVLDNDIVNGSLQSIAIVTPPIHGASVLTTGNALLYSPLSSFCGQDSLQYAICNTHGCDTAWVRIQVMCDTSGNDLLPIAVDDNGATFPGVDVNIAVLNNDIVNGVLSDIYLVNGPSDGQATLQNDHTVLYQPNTGFCGIDSLTYGICNANGCDTAYVIIHVICNPNDTLPYAIDDNAVTNQDVPVLVQVLNNDILNGVLQSIYIVSGPSQGSASLTTNDELLYAPGVNFCGQDSLQYGICNQYGCDTAWVFIQINCDTSGNDLLPIAVQDNAATQQGTAVVIAVLNNDLINGALNGIAFVSNPDNGIAVLNADHTVTYTPDPGFCGLDTLSYRICNANGCDTALVVINVICSPPGDSLPIAVEDFAMTYQEVPVTIQVLSNDLINGTLTGINLVSGPSVGTAVLTASNSVIYTPNNTFCGTDSLLYSICNTHGCDSAWVYINVQCDTSGTDLPPVAIVDHAATLQGNPVLIHILNNDITNGALTSVFLLTPASNGVGVLGLNNIVDYTPNPGFCGTDTLSYGICNAVGCDTALIIVDVICAPPGDSLPVAVDDYAITLQGNPVEIPFLNNDIPNGILLPVELLTYPANGLAVLTSGGTLVFDPQGSFCGADSVEYAICNAHGCDTAWIYIQVICDTTNNDQLPIAVQDNSATFPDEAVNIAVLDNDILNGALSDIYLVTGPSHGQVTLQNDHTVDYQPNTGFCGIDSLTYGICNGNGCDTAYVIINVICNPNDTLPYAIDDYAVTNQGVPVLIQVLNNDIVNGNLQSIYLVGSPSQGTAQFTINNELLYTPADNFCGQDSLQYGICNQYGCDTAWVFIQVTCDTSGNDLPPFAVQDNAATQEGIPVVISVLDNDLINGALISIELTSNPQNGVAILHADHTVTYVPDPAFCGQDTFSYAICNAIGCDTALIVINVICSPPGDSLPIAVDDYIGTNQGISVLIPVLNNDIVNGTLQDIYLISGPSIGTVTLHPDHTITYEPNATFCGIDSLSYGICNGFGCDTAWVYIDVQCDTSGNDLPPIAILDNAATLQGNPVDIQVLNNDIPNGALTGVYLVSQSSNGVGVLNPNNTVTYTPNSGFCGVDTFSYGICNVVGCDTALIIVNVICNPPGDSLPIAVNDNAATLQGVPVSIAVLGNDVINGTLQSIGVVTQPAHGGAIFTTGNALFYTPASNFCGQDSLTYSICNAHGCDTAWVFIQVVCDTSGNDLPPIAIQDNYATLPGVAVNIPVLNNDILNGVLTDIYLISGPSNGQASLDPDFTVTYTPDSGFCGLDTLSYGICNAVGCDTALIVVNVICNPNDTLPIAIDDYAATNQGSPVLVSVLDNDIVNGTLQSIYIINNPANGAAVLTISNAIIYTPVSSFCGADSLSYGICNDYGCDTAWVYIQVQCDTTNNDLPPIAVQDNAVTQQGTAVNIAVLSNDLINGTLADIYLVSNPSNGQAILNADNTVTYTPNPGYCGPDTLSYGICNAIGCDTALIVIEVICNPPGDSLPIAVNDFAGTAQGTSVTIQVLNNDILNGTLQSIYLVDNPANGAAVFNSGNGLVYTPDNNFCGSDSLSYGICNSYGCDTAWVYIDIQCDTSGNLLPPVAVNDTTSTLLNTPIVINILQNDTINGTLQGISIITQPANGLAVIAVGNNIFYVPNGGFCGNDSLAYAICNTVGCDTAWVFIHVQCNPIDSFPVAVQDFETTYQNTSVTFDELSNDQINGFLAGVSIITDPLHGTVVLNPDFTFTYTPDNGFCGGDLFSYALCNQNGCDTAFVIIDVICTGTCDQPPLAADDLAIINQGANAVVDVLANDSPNCPLTDLYLVNQPVHGTAVLNSDSTVTYTPDPTYCGLDTLSYGICNANGCDTALVIISIQCSTPCDQPPLAANDLAIINQGANAVVDVLANDSPNCPLTDLYLVDQPLHGTAVLNPDSTVTYTPDPTYCGLDTLSYGICNANGCDTALVIINIQCSTPCSQLPNAADDLGITDLNTPVQIFILDNDQPNCPLIDLYLVDPPLHGTAVLNADSSVTYTPDTDFCGFDTLSYAICNGNGCDTALVIIDVDCGVNPGNMPPVAVSDCDSTHTNIPLTLDVLANDTINGTLQGIYIVSQPNHGIGTINANNTITYIPEAAYCGRDTMIYAICNQDGCDTAVICIVIPCERLVIYNAVSPNGDGKNDVFTIDGVEFFPDNKLYIYNRWGSMVYQKNDYRNDWDAKWNGRDLPDGTYFYYFDDGKGTIYTGYLQIYR